MRMAKLRAYAKLSSRLLWMPQRSWVLVDRSLTDVFPYLIFHKTTDAKVVVTIKTKKLKRVRWYRLLKVTDRRLRI